MSASPTPLETLRKTAGLSRPKVSLHLGVSERHLYRFERGITPLRRPYAKLLADLYEQPLAKVEAAARKTVNGNGAAA
jgi:DNA-binding transcriptional regulator YiaG